MEESKPHRSKITVLDHAEIDGLKIQANAVLDRVHSGSSATGLIQPLVDRQCGDAISSLATDSERSPAQISLTAILPLD